VPEVQASDRHRKQTCPRTAGATATEGAIHQEPMENSRFFLFNDDPLFSTVATMVATYCTGKSSSKNIVEGMLGI